MVAAAASVNEMKELPPPPAYLLEPSATPTSSPSLTTGKRGIANVCFEPDSESDEDEITIL